jgi:hypothetical protein
MLILNTKTSTTKENIMITGHKKLRQALRLKERTQRKAMIAQENLEKQTYFKIKNLLKKVFSHELIGEIAAKTKLQKRKRKLTPIVIVSILMMGCLNEINSNPRCLNGICLLLRKWFNIYIKKQSLQATINRKETKNFIKAIMEEVIRYEAKVVIKKLFKKNKLNINLFSRILIQDSTVISLPETLKRIFRGCGGTASEAAIKCDFIIDQSNYYIVRIKCIGGRIPDNAISNDIIEYLENKDLVIRDLGYFNISQLLKIMTKQAYFISRLSKSAYVYLNKDDEEPLNLIEYLKKQNIGNKGVEIEIYLGKKERIPMRLVGIKVPPEVIETRIKKYKEIRKKAPGESLIEWNGFTLMITNIPKDRLSIKMIIKMYKMRWQIELFFKNLKSNLCIDKLTGKNKYRILCIIYIKIIMTFITTILHAYAQSIEEENEKEVSLYKFTQWLKEESRLKKALVTGNLSGLLRELERDIDLLCKEKRKRSQLEKKLDKMREVEILNKKVA